MYASRRLAEPILSLATRLRCHVIGIGGPGMSALARLLIEMGHEVTGSDQHDSEVVAQLRERGATVFIGHSTSVVQGADVVTYSTAIPSTNVELVEAQRLGIDVRHRSGMLASICAATNAVGVAGTHGKTTTTALLTAMTRAGGLSPSSIIGAEVLDRHERVHGDGSLLIIEADESDGTLDVLPLSSLIVTNIDIDHLDYFETFEGVKQCFSDVAARINGAVVLNADDAGSSELISSLGTDDRVTTFGRSELSTVRIVNTSSNVTGTHIEVNVGNQAFSCDLLLRGEHNAMNFAAALAMAIRLGIDPAVACSAASTFTGVARRFTERGSFNGSLLIDDYAHLPAEIEATIEAVRLHPGRRGRIVAVFQPNRFHRIASMADSYGDCFTGADRIVITDVYASGTERIEGVTGELVANAIKAKHVGADVVWAPSRQDTVDAVLTWIKPGDMCVSMGCGDIETFPDDLQATTL
ncbi:MAG: UDP-N-acetylmuramate--L-alanine ligase [Actinobacteria bacterium]|uniref:UDP-N-acetylmuramate--L-alanine ligase n=1 Tax=freshwater metagenome TaxID=449393 RepID=A0A6J6LKU7_9ZZZZ|nr:UDP-N-acetylmuramate--L-alanine ligase [Actinomycetota bacterium]MSZ79955.1 UDP-N-acetylmuramate--L-alanine ligase [Actinomycetota bacterium]MTB12118.1 UDP-N-acetylmuramate--L-alanine ligase [Actinomycetota bacterium]